MHRLEPPLGKGQPGYMTKHSNMCILGCSTSMAFSLQNHDVGTFSRDQHERHDFNTNRCPVVLHCHKVSDILKHGSRVSSFRKGLTLPARTVPNTLLQVRCLHRPRDYRGSLCRVVVSCS